MVGPVLVTADAPKTAKLDAVPSEGAIAAVTAGLIAALAENGDRARAPTRRSATAANSERTDNGFTGGLLSLWQVRHLLGEEGQRSSCPETVLHQP
jgi:hypothetical protein